jgi:hypothetical protein
MRRKVWYLLAENLRTRLIECDINEKLTPERWDSL